MSFLLFSDSQSAPESTYRVLSMANLCSPTCLGEVAGGVGKHAPEFRMLQGRARGIGAAKKPTCILEL